MTNINDAMSSVFDMTEILHLSLRDTNNIGDQEKLMYYKTPDFCFITPANALVFMLSDLLPLCEKRFGKDDNKQHVFFQIYQQVSEEADFSRYEPKKEEDYRIVIFFDDHFINEMGDSLGVEARVKNY